MSPKAAVSLGMIVGSLIGGYVPVLFGVSAFSMTSVLTSGVGGVIGIVVAYRWVNN